MQDLRVSTQKPLVDDEVPILCEECEIPVIEAEVVTMVYGNWRLLGYGRGRDMRSHRVGVIGGSGVGDAEALVGAEVVRGDHDASQGLQE